MTKFNPSPCCKAEVKEDRHKGELYCSKCGLVLAEMMYTTEINYNGDGRPDREFVDPFWWNCKQTKPLNKFEKQKVMYTKKYNYKVWKEAQLNGGVAKDEE